MTRGLVMALDWSYIQELCPGMVWCWLFVVDVRLCV